MDNSRGQGPHQHTERCKRVFFFVFLVIQLFQNYFQYLKQLDVFVYRIKEKMTLVFISKLDQHTTTHTYTLLQVDLVNTP